MAAKKSPEQTAKGTMDTNPLKEGSRIGLFPELIHRALAPGNAAETSLLAWYRIC